jgi:hypothetical protein
MRLQAVAFRHPLAGLSQNERRGQGPMSGFPKPSGLP